MVRDQKHKDYYAILGVAEDASPEAIKRAYRRKAREMHPDQAGAHMTRAFQELQEAYDTLRDPERRAAYDRERRARVPVQVVRGAGTARERSEPGWTCTAGPRGVPGGVLDVYLEPWELRHGTRIRPVLWVERACPTCTGWLHRWGGCRSCAGRGWLRQRVALDVRLEPPFRDGERRHLEVDLPPDGVLCLDLVLHLLA